MYSCIHPSLENFVDKNNNQLTHALTTVIKTHCVGMIQTYDKYFAEDFSENYWFQKQFADIEMLLENFTARHKEQIYKLNCDLKH